MHCAEDDVSRTTALKTEVEVGGLYVATREFGGLNISTLVLEKDDIFFITYVELVHYMYIRRISVLSSRGSGKITLTIDDLTRSFQRLA